MPAVATGEQRNSEPRAEPREIVRLGDVLNVIRGASPRPKGDPKYFGGDIPWIMIGDVTREPGKYLSRTREHVTTAGAAKSRYLKAGTLILSNSGTVCVPRILAVDGCIHDGFVAFPDLPKSLDKNYLYWFFEHIRPSIIEANRQGITQVNLNTSIVREIRLPMVSLDQQRSIVAEIEKQFSRLDEAVANLKRVKANLKRYKAAVLKAAVEGRLVPTEAELARREGRSYETGEQILQRILETRRSQWKGKGKYKEPAAPDATDLPELPDGWVWGTADQLSDKITDGEHLSPDVLSGGIPLLSAKDVRDSGVTFDEAKYVSAGDATKFRARCDPEIDDILIVSRGATIGRACRINVDRKFCLMGSVILMKLHNLVEPNYALTALKAGFFLTRLTGVSGSTAQQAIYIRDIRPLPLPIPPLAEQHRIAAEVDRRLSFVHEVETEVEANMARTGRLRQSVLSTSFGGGGPQA